LLDLREGLDSRERLFHAHFRPLHLDQESRSESCSHCDAAPPQLYVATDAETSFPWLEQITFLNGFGDDNPPAEAIYAEYAQSECN
jgi:hypothetical protein